MHLHILGICGTFMSGIAAIAKQSGHHVTGSDLNVYPPMSTQLEAMGIPLMEGYHEDHFKIAPDCVIVGNVIKRGNPAIEYVLENNIPYLSGPEWLAKTILQKSWVCAVSGTHGKTTTTSLVAWILEYAGLKPSFLIGGVPENFGVSAKLNQSSFFVIEADEYDSAFFDKRSKFIHYHPKTAILNNLEFDHADIFPDLAAIKQQFHHFVRTIPRNGLIVHPAYDSNLQDVLNMGCWTNTTTFGSNGEWQAILNKSDGSEFTVFYKGMRKGDAVWNLIGRHNVENALAAIAASQHLGVLPEQAIEALAEFKNVKRRLEIKSKTKDVIVYDDFAHHPTAIATTLSGLRAKIGNQRIVAVVEFGSYTMRTGCHKDKIKEAFQLADMVVCKATESNWGLESILASFTMPGMMYSDVDSLVAGLVPQLRAGDHVVVMSNSGFGGIHNKLTSAIEQQL